MTGLQTSAKLLFFTSLTALLSCGLAGDIREPNVNENPGSQVNIPKQILLESGNLQTIRVGETAPLPLVVKIQDEEGNTYEGESIQFSLIEGSAQFISNADQQTDEAGNAQMIFEMGTEVSPVIVKANWLPNPEEDPDRAVFFELEAKAGLPQAPTLVSGGSQCTIEGQMFANDLVYRLTDSYGNPINGEDIEITPTNGLVNGRSSMTTLTTGEEGEETGEISFTVTAGTTPAEAYDDNTEIKLSLKSSPNIVTNTSLRHTKPYWLTNHPDSPQTADGTFYGIAEETLSVLALAECDIPIPSRQINFYIEDGSLNLRGHSFTNGSGVCTFDISGFQVGSTSMDRGYTVILARDNLEVLPDFEFHRLIVPE